MIRITLFVAFFMLLLGCIGGQQSDPPPFEGRWRKYEDEEGRFVEFNNGKITIGDNSTSSSGDFQFEIANDAEPLYDIRAVLPAETLEFELYYEKDTISLFFDDDKELEGLYEINFNVVPVAD